MTPLTHSLPPTISKKTGLSHQHRLHVFNHTNSDCFPFRFYFNTKKCINTQRQDSRTSRTTTSDIWSSSANISSWYILPWIRINSCYYCALLLLPWVLFEICICILSFTILPPSCWRYCFPALSKKKCFLFPLSKVRTVEWQVQKSWLSQPRNVYIICPKHQILWEKWSLLSNSKKNSLHRKPPAGAGRCPSQ